MLCAYVTISLLYSKGLTIPDQLFYIGNPLSQKMGPTKWEYGLKIANIGVEIALSLIEIFCYNKQSAISVSCQSGPYIIINNFDAAKVLMNLSYSFALHKIEQNDCVIHLWFISTRIYSIHAEKISDLQNKRKNDKDELRRKDRIISELDAHLEAARTSNNHQNQIQEISI